MRITLLKLFIVVFCASVLSITAQAKPDNVDGVNVPSGRIPQEIKDNKYPRSYYPNTEKIGKAEMRITACGTGMPTQTPSNAAACFLVELGNGESFLFDLGIGSTERLSGLELDYSKLDKVFASHLHTDHVGDIAALWVGGWLSGRFTPLQAYWVTSQIHTPAQGFGKIMSAVKPRLAVAYHYWNHRDLELDMYQAVRETYDGPLAMAADMTVINLTRDHIEVREVTYNHEAWAQGTSREWDTAPRGEPATGVMSDWLKAGTVKEMIVPPKEPSE